MSFIWKQQGQSWVLESANQQVLAIPVYEDCQDSFEQLSDNAWRWTRRTAVPVTEMKMQLNAQDAVRYWQVPSVNYNGNGWGSGAQYSGYALDGEPWTYAWHRVAIPACTYAESEHFCIGLFGEEKGGMSGSIWEEGGASRQALLWPEQEGPKVLFKRCWMEPFHGTMDPQNTFVAIVYAAEAKEIRQGYHGLLDFAWQFFARDMTMPKTPEQLIKLDTLFFRQLWHQQFDGLVGFRAGMHWEDSAAAFVKSNGFEIGWVGQNASVACHLLRQYIATGDEDLKNKALSALDSWMKHGVLENGMMLAKLVAPPDHVDSVINGDIPIDLDACNLGTAATYLFEAAKLAEKSGSPRPSYRQAALGLCDFACRVQQPTGEFAKSWFMDGTINAKHGVIGVFFTLPLFAAYEETGDQKYLTAALRSFDFYYGEFMRTGYTTAGALDSNCIDKESAAPLIRAALQCYHATKDRKYINAAEEVAYYLATWQWHYSVSFPKDSMAGKSGFDTYGSTSVSAAHNALDHYGIYYVPEYAELAELTGNPIWRSRARALWYSGSFLISDGTLVLNNRVRPAGSQDESVRHTRWGRPDKRYFTLSEWLTNWQGTFRQVALCKMDNWDLLR